MQVIDLSGLCKCGVISCDTDGHYFGGTGNPVDLQSGLGSGYRCRDEMTDLCTAIVKRLGTRACQAMTSRPLLRSMITVEMVKHRINWTRMYLRSGGSKPQRKHARTSNSGEWHEPSGPAEAGDGAAAKTPKITTCSSQNAS